MKLNLKCPQCGRFLEGFTFVREDSDWEKGEFVVVCYNCRTPDGGLQPYVDFRCEHCGRSLDPRILELHHKGSRFRKRLGFRLSKRGEIMPTVRRYRENWEGEEILCPNCHRIETYDKTGTIAECPHCKETVDLSAFEFSHEVKKRICANCHAIIHRIEQKTRAVAGRKEDCPHCLETRGELVKGVRVGTMERWQDL